MLEAEVAGFGASGRNGGWCSALFPASLGRRSLAPRPRATPCACTGRCGRPSARWAASSRPRASTRELPARRHDRPGPHAGCSWTGCGPTWRPRTRAGSPRTTCGCSMPTRHVAGSAASRRPRRRLHPALRGGAPGTAGPWPCPGRRGGAACRSSSDPGARHRARAGCDTDHGTVRAEVVLRATEGYTPRLAGQRRAVVPVYSLMVATEPLPDDVWERSGCASGRRSATTPPDHLRPAHRRRPAGVRRPRARRTTSARGSGRRTTGSPGCSTSCGPRCATCSRCCGDAAFTHAWGGAWACPRLGRLGGAGPSDRARLGRRLRRRRRRHDEPGRPDAARPGRRRATASWSRCPGWATAAGGGSRSRCAGSGSTPACEP